ncbi:MAG: SAM-dependent methyltransferase, partial [Anaerotignum sp.]|nr:SAM-dependent methyltransferase [Anaerotignum sp.]
SRAKTEFVLARAEEYEVLSEVNRYYFFNPFSVEILRKVMAKIMESHEKDPREMLLFFYYPSQEYLSYLMEVDGLELYDEIACGDLFEGNDQRERVMVFQMRK